MGRTSDFDRAVMAQMFSEGATTATIKARVNTSSKTIAKWRKEWHGGNKELLDKPKSGRPRKLESSAIKAIKRKLVKNQHRSSAAAVTRGMKVKVGLDVHRTTVTRALAYGKSALQVVKAQPMKRLSAVNKAKRVAFCQARKGKRLPLWVFLDGSVFTLYKGENANISARWVKKGEKAVKVRGKLIAHFFVYAAVWRGGRTKLYFVPPSWYLGCKGGKSEETFKSEHYIQVIKGMEAEWRDQIGSRHYEIIRDNAKQHVSMATTVALSPLNLPILEEYPPFSFDLNAIERVWAQLKRLVEDRRPRTAAGYKLAIQQAWRDLPQTTIDKIISSIKGNVDKIAENGGEWLNDYAAMF